MVRALDLQTIVQHKCIIFQYPCHEIHAPVSIHNSTAKCMHLNQLEIAGFTLTEE